MNTELLTYIQNTYPTLSNLTWLQESTTMHGEELFEDNSLQIMFANRTLNTVLHYPVEINSVILPFEIYENGHIIAMGYMNDENQNVLYLKHEKSILINLL